MSRLGTGPIPRLLAVADDAAGGVLLFLKIVLLCWVPAKGFAQEFTVEGFFNIQVPRLPNKAITGAFTLSVKNCNWLIRSRRFDEVFDYKELGYDGTNLYSVFNFETRQSDRKRQGLRVGSNLATGEVVRGPFPQVHPEEHRILWLAFASGCYLSKPHDGKLEPITSHSSRKAALYGFQQPVHLTLTDGHPRFPLFIAYFDEGFVYKWPSESPGYITRPPAREPWPRPYDKGFTNSVLRVQSFFTGRPEIPKEATFSVYYPRADGLNNKDLALLRTVHVLATNLVMTSAAKARRPALPGPTLVSDKRFERDATPVFNVVYEIDGLWLTDEEVKHRPEYAKAVREQTTDKKVLSATAGLQPGQNRRIRPLVLILFAVVSLLGLIVIIRGNIKLRKEKHNAESK